MGTKGKADAKVAAEIRTLTDERRALVKLMTALPVHRAAEILCAL